MLQIKITVIQSNPELVIEDGVKTVVISPEHSSVEIENALVGILTRDEMNYVTKLWSSSEIKRKFLVSQGAVYILNK
jgi:hypothetical protein